MQDGNIDLIDNNRVALCAGSREERSERGPFVIQRTPRAEEEEAYDNSYDSTESQVNERRTLANQIEILPPSSLIPSKHLSSTYFTSELDPSVRNTTSPQNENSDHERLEGMCEEEEEDDDESLWSLNSVVCHPDSLACAVRMSCHVTQQPEVTN